MASTRLARTLARALAAPALALIAASAAAQTLYNDPRGIAVPRDFGCVHHIGLEICWPCLNGNHLYHGPDPQFDARINAIRLYGMGGLAWGNDTEKSPGQFDWKHWDAAFAKFRKIGVKSVIYTVYNPPQFYLKREHNYGGWRGQLPNSRDVLDRWLTTITKRYPEIDVIEVANEVFGPGIDQGFWIGTEQELMTLADWVLDWRRKAAWKGRVWSPSIPGFLGNVEPFVKWLSAYPRTAEFDAIPGHFYYLLPDQMGTRADKSNKWSSFVELRDALRRAGIRQPIVDGEKGFAPGAATPASIYNYGVRALLAGIEQVCFFHWGSHGKDETNLGQPYANPEVKKAFEELSALAGKRIVRVERAGRDQKLKVTTADAPSH